MKVVFLQDVPNVAKAGETKEVADGYGRNFLIPRKLALLAKPGSTSIIQAQLKTKTQTEEELIELSHRLESTEVTLKARAGAKGRLHGSITSADIASELQSSTGLIVDKRKIGLDEPIRQLGSHEVAIKLAKDIIPKIKVVVAEEEAEKEKETEKKAKAAKAKAEKKETEEKGKAKAKKKETEKEKE